MADYVPVYMTTYDEDGPQVNLVDLTLTAATFVDNDPEDTAIGTVEDMADDRSVLSLVDDAGGKVKLVDNELLVGGTAAEAGDFEITIREDSQYAMGSPRLTTFTITVTAAG